MQHNLADIDIALIGLCNEDYSLVLIECELRKLGDFREQFADYCHIEDEEERLRLSAKLGEALSVLFPEDSVILHRYNLWLEKVAGLRQNLYGELLDFMPELDEREDELDLIATIIMRTLALQSYRIIRIAPGGIGENKSIKPSNLLISFEKIATALAGFTLNVGSVLEGKHPIYVVALMWLSFTIVKKAATENIHQKDASVFWGLIKAANSNYPGQGAEEVKVVKFTNSERADFGEPKLPPEEIRRSLEKLEKLRSIELVDGKWYIREAYTVTD